MNDSRGRDNKHSFVMLQGHRVDFGNATVSDIRDFLDGIEKATKYFIATDYPAVSKGDYEIEVRVEPGSLVVYLVGLVATGAVSVVTAFGIAYFKKAGEQLAVNDVSDKTTADVIDGAMRKMKSTVRIAKHIGGMGKKTFSEAKISDNNTIVLPNESGEEMLVTKEELDTYSRAPKDVFRKMTSSVDADTELILGESNESKDSSSVTRIKSSDREYFGAHDVESDGIVFPEWQDGEHITLQGVLCRANTNTGTLGFVYKGHTITSYLYQMEIQNIKDSLFDKEVEIDAVIIRTQQKMDAEDELKKPKLEIRKITSIGSIDKHENASLLDRAGIPLT